MSDGEGHSGVTDAKSTFCPIVLWSQRKETISLKVQLAGVKDPKLDLTETSLSFKAEGNGAQGCHVYKFKLDFFQSIDPEGCVYKLSDNFMELHLTKAGKAQWWPRLVPGDTKKPHFLKLNFDKWSTESDEEALDEKEVTEAAHGTGFNGGKKPTSFNFGKIYLLTYNCLQFLFFLIIVGVCVRRRWMDASDFCPHAYSTIGWLVNSAVILSYMEAIHPILGLVKSSPMQPFVQVTGRCIALYAAWLTTGEAEGCAVNNLFIAWSLAEVIRYPTYICQLVGVEFKLLTWLRYHSWILLYPFGGYCEYVVITSAARYLDDTNSHQLSLPNHFNWAFKLSTVLRCYVLVLVSGVLVLMRHMWKMRQRKFGNRRKLKPA
uniref:Very-long-chain (3R)-3-hydroxyacyl-CoA dehydratase n=1 Tax=Ciona savignyi TaxID=51511 RepID=H2YIW2_CIOSA